MRTPIPFFSAIASLSVALVNAGCPPSSDCEVLLTCGPASDAQGGDQSGGAGVGGASTGGSAEGGSTARGFRAIAAGYDTTCAIGTDDSVWCWGANDHGQLGNGRMAATNSPVQVVTVMSAEDVTTDNHSCALAGGGMFCWGLAPLGDGGGSSDSPVSIGLGKPAIAVSTGLHSPIGAHPFHTCVALNDGTGRCWGANIYGEVGMDPVSTPTAIMPMAIQNLSGATSITSGTTHSCALTGAQIQCWGQGVALGNSQGTDSHTPVAVQNLSSPTQVDAGLTHTCARTNSGQVRCWGAGTFGQLGNNSTSNSLLPVTVSGLSSAIQVSAGAVYSCAVTSGGEVWCWGHNLWGQLGDGSTNDSPVPVKVVELTSAKQVSAGRFHTCAVTNDERALCWGNNEAGQLGDSSNINSVTPVEVTQP